MMTFPHGPSDLPSAPFLPLSLLSTQPGAAKPPKGIASLVLVGMTCLLCMFGYHATYVSSIAYSSPSIVIDAGRMPDGRRVLYDDYREAYYWLRQVGEKLTTAWRQTEQPVSQSRASTLTPLLVVGLRAAEHRPERQDPFVVGLRLPDVGHGQPHRHRRQQHLEQHAHRHGQ